MDRPYGHPKFINRPVTVYPFSWEPAKKALTYRQHIARLRSIYPNSRVLRELHEFFDGPADDKWYATFVTIADFVEGEFTLRTTCSAEDLRSHVSVKNKEASPRIILLEYESKRSLDRNILDVLGNVFGINPVFFYKHITLNRFGSETPFFASEQDGMELKMQRSFVSSFICQEHVDSGLEREPFSTVILLAQTHRMEPVDQARWQRMHGLDFLPNEDLYNEENGSISALFNSWLFLLTPTQMDELNKHPVWFILPLCKFILMGFARKFEVVEDVIRACEIESLSNVWNISRFQFDLAYLRKLKKDLSKTSDSIRDAQRRHPVLLSESVLMDCEELNIRAQQLQDDFRDLLNRYVGLASLQESKKSIEQAESVRQLNRLAFLFLPLSFATSLLGMNVVEFGQGTLEIWIFFPVAVGISLMVLALYLYYHHAYRWIRRQWRRFFV